MKTITIVTACYNEEDNIAEVYRQVKEVFSEKLPVAGSDGLGRPAGCGVGAAEL